MADQQVGPAVCGYLLRIPSKSVQSVLSPQIDVLPQGVSADTRANNFLHALPTAVNGTEVRVHMVYITQYCKHLDRRDQLKCS